MKTARLLLALCLAPVSALAQESAPAAPARPAPSTSGSSEQEAGDVSEVDKDRMGPLRERVSPVSGHLFLKKGRFEFSPSATLSLTDAFFTKYIFGGTLTYHPLETLGLSLRAGYAVPTVAGAAQICTFTNEGDGSTTRGCHLPTLEDLDEKSAPGHISLIGGVDAQWAPIYGKVSLLAEQFVHFDLYGIAGASALRYRGPDQSSLMTVGGNVGVGMRFFLNRWLTVRTEFRDLIYVEKSVNPAQMLRNQLLFELGVSFFFPTAHPES
ncbi:MAG TPA: outer membrane beta-barrel domain-containing protein [Archangium sp.]|jgi:outer membrane beta-barrel protein|uniref:outer membrane beta-barrel domain-containing protein n=1 Tax=Archangium sp. TaxID=1872627 RepID=UPI002ED91990